MQSTIGTFMKVRDEVLTRTVARMDRDRHYRARGARRPRRNSGDRSQTQVTDAFWRDPPWRGGKGGYRMGLRPIAPQQWLPDRIDAAERARKQRLLADPASGVFAAIDGSVPGQQKILDAVTAFTGERDRVDRRGAAARERRIARSG